LKDLSSQLEYLFKNNLNQLAVKNKSKTLEEDKAFKVAEKVFEEFDS
jgi:hypothetical protein